eukprot:g784.t1
MYHVFFTIIFFIVVDGSVLNIDHFGALTKNETITASQANSNAINKAFMVAKPGDTILIPKGGEYFCIGGIEGNNLINVTLSIQGQLRAYKNKDVFKYWPLADSVAQGKASYKHFIHFTQCSGLTIAGSTHYPSKADGTGNSLIDGNGLVWWNKYVISTSHAKRPKLVVIETSDNILVENITMLNSPSFHLALPDILNVEVRYVTINVDRKLKSELKLEGLQPEDLNTDGIDPSGKNVYVHHVKINNDDDSIAVKPCSQDTCRASCSENMVFEDMIVTGMGLSIGSVPPHENYMHCVRNISFRRINMPKTGKGIYVKSNPTCGINKTAIIENILYEDMNITYPRWWAIWIGPQQQHEPGQALGTKCPLDYPITKKCPTQSCVTFNNITLRNIYIDKPVLSPGVILGNASNPMTNIVFDNVVVNDPAKWPFDHKYQCKHAVSSLYSYVSSTYVVL